MFKILIVDDEIWICRLIQCTIDWENLDMEVIGFAHNGEEGLLSISEHQPDIVITDVRMPVMNGIEMIENVRACETIKNQPHFVIISGYQDFEYVQTALRSGASDYILKPYDEEHLNETLLRIREKIGQDATRSKDEQAVRRQLSESIGKLRKTGLHSFFHGNTAFESLREFNLEFSFDFSVDHFSLFYLRVNNITGAASSRQLLVYIADRFINYFQGASQCLAFSYVENGAVIIVVNHPLMMDAAVQNVAKNVFTMLLGDRSINKQVLLSMGYSDESVPIARLRELFLSARDGADCRLLFGYGRVYNLSQLDLQRRKTQELLSEADRAELGQAVESFDIKRLRDIISNLYEPMLSDERTHPRNLYEIATLIVERFCVAAKKMNIPQDCVVPEEEMLFRLELCKSMSDFPQFLYDELSKTLTSYQAMIREGPSKPIQAAINYIERHYGEQVHLADIVKEVYLSPQYFSELFKSEVGINFSDYLANYRIEAAKKLLSTPGEKVKDICLKVGYTDSKAFSKLFKKCVGLTPREYQKMFS